MYKVTVITTTTFDTIFISKYTTSCGETKVSFVQNFINITGSRFYVCDSKIILYVCDSKITLCTTR
jgi:hypothetical protein